MNSRKQKRSCPMCYQHIGQPRAGKIWLLSFPPSIISHHRLDLKIYDIVPQGEENAIPAAEVCRILGVTPRERRAIAARELNEGLLVLYTTEKPGGYFKPSPGEKGRQEIQRFRARELARLRSFGKKIKVADDILRQCTGQTQLDPPCAPKEV